MKSKNSRQRKPLRKKRDQGHEKGRRTRGGKDTIAHALILVLADAARALDRTPLAEDKVPEGECLLVVGALLDVRQLAPGTDPGVPPSAGGVPALLHPLVAAHQALARLKKQ